MADLLPAFMATLNVEGGYVDSPTDRGGKTKYGISSRQYPYLDIENLTIDEALGIYRRDYWDLLGLGKLHSQAIAEEIFDTAVNMGPQTAVEIAQRSLNYLGHGLAIDGLLGPITTEALNDYAYERALLKALNGVQFMIYLNIVEMDPEQGANARGWLKRIKLRV